MSDAPSKADGPMPDDDDDVDLAAEESSPASDDAAPRVGKPIPSSEPKPFDLEDDDDVPQAMKSVHSLDVCPNCGAPMRGSGEVLCMRCGFDLKTMKQVKVATGVVEVDPDQPADGDTDLVPRRKPIVLPGMGGSRLPLVAAAVAALILTLGYMAGLAGLFTPNVNDKGEIIAGTVSVGRRFLGLGRFAVMSLVWTGCGIGALAFLAHLNGLRLGDLKLAASRMLGIVVVAQLVRFLNFAGNGLEWVVEAVLASAVFAGLSIVLFGIKPKDTPILVGGTIILFLITWVSAWLVITGTG